MTVMTHTHILRLELEKMNQLHAPNSLPMHTHTIIHIIHKEWKHMETQMRSNAQCLKMPQVRQSEERIAADSFCTSCSGLRRRASKSIEQHRRAALELLRDLCGAALRSTCARYMCHFGQDPKGYDMGPHMFQMRNKMPKQVSKLTCSLKFTLSTSFQGVADSIFALHFATLVHSRGMALSSTERRCRNLSRNAIK